MYLVRQDYYQDGILHEQYYELLSYEEFYDFIKNVKIPKYNCYVAFLSECTFHRYIDC